MLDDNQPKQLLEPIYDFSVAPEPVCLQRDVDLVITYGTQRLPLKADMVLEFFPKPSILIKSKIYLDSLSKVVCDLMSLPDDISFALNNKEVSGLIGRIDSNRDPVELTIVPKKSPVSLIKTDNQKVKNTEKTIFHLFNFPRFIGRKTRIETSSSVHFLNYIELKNSEWETVIHELASTKDAFDKIKKKGGLQLTYIAELRTSNNEEYSYENYREQIKLISAFLSFVQGFWFWPVCSTGLDKNNSVLWREWSSPNSASTPAYSWFCIHNAGQAEQLFPLFSELWNTSIDWKDTLKTSIYWYTQASLGGKGMGIDSSIILAQSALERLAYHYLVNHKKSISDKGFNDLRASDRFRLFFSSLNMPLEIPDYTPRIKSNASKLNWVDAPHALTFIRNSLVHPKIKNKTELQGCYIDGWKMILWYLELSILALCGYRGTYSNRLNKKWTGQVETVPWAT